MSQENLLLTLNEMEGTASKKVSFVLTDTPEPFEFNRSLRLSDLKELYPRSGSVAVIFHNDHKRLTAGIQNIEQLALTSDDSPYADIVKTLTLTEAAVFFEVLLEFTEHSKTGLLNSVFGMGKHFKMLVDTTGTFKIKITPEPFDSHNFHLVDWLMIGNVFGFNDNNLQKTNRAIFRTALAKIHARF